MCCVLCTLLLAVLATVWAGDVCNTIAIHDLLIATHIVRSTDTRYWDTPCLCSGGKTTSYIWGGTTKRIVSVFQQMIPLRSRALH